jgi:chaperone modulatory protein CbpM
LQAELQIEWAGVSLALQLLDELEYLRDENSHLRRRLSRFEQT